MSYPAWAEGLVNIYIYIYIVIYRQTVSLYHNSSVWLDTQDTSSWEWNPPNFISLLSPQATYVSSGIITHYVLAFICLHFCVTRYQSAPFVTRYQSAPFVRNIFKEYIFQTHQGLSSMMHCLHCWFQVFVHSTGSSSNSDLDPEFPGHLLESIVLRTLILLLNKIANTQVFIKRNSHQW